MGEVFYLHTYTIATWYFCATYHFVIVVATTGSFVRIDKDTLERKWETCLSDDVFLIGMPQKRMQLKIIRLLHLARRNCTEDIILITFCNRHHY